MENNNEYLSPEEVAELLKVHINTVYRWIDEGEIPAAKIGGTWRILKSDIDAKFASGK